jgi:hypothetical protein
MRDWVFASAWIAGMLAAPYTLVRLGNLAGAFQWGLLPLIALAALVIWLNSADLHLLMNASTQAHDEITPLATAFGPHAAALLLTAGRLMTAVTASTVLLVTSGFAFNETLAHWFPNFGFAFLLLTLVLAAGIGGPKTAGILQVVASSTALIGIVLLIVLGLLAGPYADSANEPGGGPLSWHGLFSALLVFVGFEAALNHRFDHPGTWKRSVQVVIGLFTVTFALWCCIALLAVSPDRAGRYLHSPHHHCQIDCRAERAHHHGSGSHCRQLRSGQCPFRHGLPLSGPGDQLQQAIGQAGRLGWTPICRNPFVRPWRCGDDDDRHGRNRCHRRMGARQPLLLAAVL